MKKLQILGEEIYTYRYNSLIQNFYKILAFEISILQSKIKYIFEGECTNFWGYFKIAKYTWFHFTNYYIFIGKDKLNIYV